MTLEPSGDLAPPDDHLRFRQSAMSRTMYSTMYQDGKKKGAMAHQGSAHGKSNPDSGQHPATGRISNKSQTKRNASGLR